MRTRDVRDVADAISRAWDASWEPAQLDTSRSAINQHSSSKPKQGTALRISFTVGMRYTGTYIFQSPFAIIPGGIDCLPASCHLINDCCHTCVVCFAVAVCFAIISDDYDWETYRLGGNQTCVCVDWERRTLSIQDYRVRCIATRNRYEPFLKI